MSKKELFNLAQSQIQQPSHLSIHQTNNGIQINYQNQRVANIDIKGNLTNYDASKVIYEYPRKIQGEIRRIITNLILKIK